MYRTDRLYKIQLKNEICYTGYITEEDELNIKIRTTRNEIIILSKDSIRQSREVEEWKQ